MTAHNATAPRFAHVRDRFTAMLGPGLGAPSAFEAAEVSPDGRLVAVVCRISDTLAGSGRTELRILAVDGSGSWTVTAADGDAAGPRWSPDGARLAFLADHGSARHRFVPWVLEVTADGAAAMGGDGLGTPPLASSVAGPGGPGGPCRFEGLPGIAEHVRWSPDGTRLVVVIADEHAEQADGLGSGTMGQDTELDLPDWYPEIETTDGADEWRTAWWLDVTSGAVGRVSPDGCNTWEADWLGNDAVVAVVSDAPAEDAWYRARIVRLGPVGPVAGPATITELYRPEWQVQFVAGSPDGRRAAVIEGVASDRYFTAGDIVLLEGDGSGARSVGWVGADLGAVRWDGPDRLVALGTDGMETVILSLDPDGGAVEELHRTAAEPGGAWTQVTTGGGVVAVSISGPDLGERVVSIAAAGGKATVLLDSEHAGHDEVRAAIAVKRVEEWTARDGTRIQGVLLLPAGTAPFPAILWVHGGPVGAAGLGFNSPTIAVLVEAGYAVLTPNPRGSTGRGRAFAAAVVGDMGGEDAFDLLAAADHLVASGIADPARLVVAGVSYGGYVAALLPALDDRFAAAIVGSPLTDLLSSYYSSSLTVFVHDFVGGRPEADPARYIARSSVFAGARLRTPSLISVGARDRATPPGQAMEHFRALREQGTPAQLLVYPEEGHGIRALEARMDWVARILDWLDRFAPTG